MKKPHTKAAKGTKCKTPPEAATEEALSILESFYDLLQEIQRVKRPVAKALNELLEDVVRDAYDGNTDTRLGRLSGWSLNEMDASEGLRLFVTQSHDNFEWLSIEEITRTSARGVS